MYRHGKEEIEAVSRVLASGRWLRFPDPGSGHPGEAVSFEKEWRAALGSPHATFVSSGTAALMMAYAGLKLGPGDEVIIPGYTWLATAHAALALGVIPVLVDVDESLTMDPEAVERAIGPRTKAICPVHMNGFAADMDRIMDLAARRNLFVIEDACQADGGLWKDAKRLGTIGDAGAYSFNYYKVISCADGGMFVSREFSVWETAMIYHDSGIGFRPNAKEIKAPIFAGINLRGSEILAAIARVQLKRLEGIITDLHRVRDTVLKGLESAQGLKLLPLNGGAGTGTGATLGFQFADRREAELFQRGLDGNQRNPGAYSLVALDSGRHVYTNWEAVMEKRGAANPGMDPYLLPANAGGGRPLDEKTLGRTLDMLGRSVLISMNPDWTESQARDLAAAILASVPVGSKKA